MTGLSCISQFITSASKDFKHRRPRFKNAANDLLNLVSNKENIGMHLIRDRVQASVF